MDQTETQKHYWLYTLLLNEGKYYVGITSQKDPQTRINQHINGTIFTSRWVEEYPYERLVELIELGDITKAEAEEIESQYTLHYMDSFGYNNVRGGHLTYRGQYKKLGNRFYTKQQFDLLIGVSFMTFVLFVTLTELLRR